MNPIHHPSAAGPAAVSLSQAVHLHMELSKARLTFMVLITTLVGFFMASQSVSHSIPLLVCTLLGTALAAAGANGMNQWIEHLRDARMERTRNRPLPSGRMGRSYAFIWSLSAAAAGTWILAWSVNGISALLAFANFAIYVLIYTPLKPRTTLCTLAGAVCGAIPPMIGWAAVTGSVDYGAWILGAILFVWQIPHFMALAWMYRRDYERGGFRMLPIIDPDGRFTCRVIVIYTLALIPIGLAVFLSGLAGGVYAAGSLILGAGFLLPALQLARSKTNADARRVFLASLIYLPVLLGLMAADHAGAGNGGATALAGERIEAPAPPSPGIET